MAWNEPSNNNNDPDKDPWGNNKKGKDQGPPDLDEVFNNLTKKLNSILGGSGNNNSNNGGNGNGKGPSLGKGGAIGLGLAGVVALGIWVFSGFYTIGEAEKGVVLRFGQYDRIVEPGLNWKATFVDKVIPVNVQAIRSLRATGLMLTKEENVVNIEMDIQYRIFQPERYLFSVVNADDSLRQATDSALRAVIGDATMDEALTKGRQQIREQTQVFINKIIDKYDMGIEIVDVNFQSSRAPDAVKDAFDDAISAREDEERYIREAEAYQNDILPKAKGRAERVKKEAQGYAERVINGAEGKVAQFNKLLPEYKQAKEVTRKRLYIETMERVYQNTSKVMVSGDNNGNLLYLPLDKLMQQVTGSTTSSVNRTRDQDAANYGIQLESAKTLPVSDSTSRSSSTRQGRN